MLKQKRDKENRLLSWSRRNKKVLYWPFGGLIYFILLIILYYIPPIIGDNLLAVPFFIAIQLLTFLNKQVHLSDLTLIVFGFILIESILYGIGYINQKIKKIWIKMVLFLLFIAIIVFVMIILTSGTHAL